MRTKIPYTFGSHIVKYFYEFRRPHLVLHPLLAGFVTLFLCLAAWFDGRVVLPVEHFAMIAVGGATGMGLIVFGIEWSKKLYMAQPPTSS